MGAVVTCVSGKAEQADVQMFRISSRNEWLEKVCLSLLKLACQQYTCRLALPKLLSDESKHQ
jgi:hypothetical protein